MEEACDTFFFVGQLTYGLFFITFTLDLWLHNEFPWNAFGFNVIIIGFFSYNFSLVVLPRLEALCLVT